jgi:hypothetical protein
MGLINQGVAKHPICPTFVHDEMTRIAIIIVALVFCSLMLWKATKYFNDT